MNMNADVHPDAQAGVQLPNLAMTSPAQLWRVTLRRQAPRLWRTIDSERIADRSYLCQTGFNSDS